MPVIIMPGFQDVGSSIPALPGDISTATFDGISFSVSTQDAITTGVHFKPDGTKMYTIGDVTNRVHQYTLSTPWDITTAIYDNVSFLTGGSSPSGVTFSPNGTELYTTEGANTDRVYQYTLSVAWDLSTASLTGSFSVVSQSTSPQGVRFHPDGTRMFVIDYTNSGVYQYTLSTPWLVTTASFDASFLGATQDANNRDIEFAADGTKFFIPGQNTDRIYQYSMSTPWDVSTASYDVNFISTSAQANYGTDMTFKPDQTIFFVVDFTTVYQYSF